MNYNAVVAISADDIARECASVAMVAYDDATTFSEATEAYDAQLATDYVTFVCHSRRFLHMPNASIGRDPCPRLRAISCPNTRLAAAGEPSSSHCRFLFAYLPDAMDLWRTEKGEWDDAIGGHVICYRKYASHWVDDPFSCVSPQRAAYDDEGST